jgi:hypothetical protein
MNWVEPVGYLASGLVLLTFYMSDMPSLRVTALCSNVAFICYGFGRGILPVVLLHGILMPINSWRLRNALRAAGRDFDAYKSETCAPVYRILSYVARAQRTKAVQNSLYALSAASYREAADAAKYARRARTFRYEVIQNFCGEDRATYKKWLRGVSATYLSALLLMILSVAAFEAATAHVGTLVLH